MPQVTDRNEVPEANPSVPIVLIADDDPAIVRYLADRCEKIGFKVETATNGIQALIKARRTQPDVLIVDVNMPQADGLSVCTRLLEPGGKIPVMIVITGSKDPETFERCRSLGTFHGQKGPQFWGEIASALAEVFPDMADRIVDAQESWATNATVHRRPRVLVVDNDPDVGRFLGSRLAKCGVDMLYAADGLQGYQIACRSEPSAVISDYSMANGDAYYLLTKLRSTPKMENTPFFVITGKSIDAVAEQVLTREIFGHPGAARIFKKSLDVTELFAALETICGFDKHRMEPAESA